MLKLHSKEQVERNCAERNRTKNLGEDVGMCWDTQFPFGNDVPGT